MLADCAGHELRQPDGELDALLVDYLDGLTKIMALAREQAGEVLDLVRTVGSPVAVETTAAILVNVSATQDLVDAALCGYAHQPINQPREVL